MDKLTKQLVAMLLLTIAGTWGVVAYNWVQECSSACDVCVVHMDEEDFSYECKMEDVSHVKIK